jgi:hypothetical protein
MMKTRHCHLTYMTRPFLLTCTCRNRFPFLLTCTFQSRFPFRRTCTCQSCDDGDHGRDRGSQKRSLSGHGSESCRSGRSSRRNGNGHAFYPLSLKNDRRSRRYRVHDGCGCLHDCAQKCIATSSSTCQTRIHLCTFFRCFLWIRFCSCFHSYQTTRRSCSCFRCDLVIHFCSCFHSYQTIRRSYSWFRCFLLIRFCGCFHSYQTTRRSYSCFRCYLLIRFCS